jgi:hypothetical protein
MEPKQNSGSASRPSETVRRRAQAGGRTGKPHTLFDLFRLLDSGYSGLQREIKFCCSADI